MSDGELIKSVNLKPASFIADKGRNKSVGIVVDLLKKKIAESAPITKDNIIDAYLDFTFGEKEKVVRVGYANHHWGRCLYTREVLLERRSYLERMSMNWFKSNLGAAIIAGKLLVIPVIEAD